MTFLIFVLFLSSVFMAVLSLRTLLTIKAENDTLLKPAQQFSLVRANLIRAADIYKKTADEMRLSSARKDITASQAASEPAVSQDAAARTETSADASAAGTQAEPGADVSSDSAAVKTVGGVSYDRLAGIDDAEPQAADGGAGSIHSPENASSVFSGMANLNGHVVCLDPGHQSFDVDMSATEPNGPGSSTMKVLCTTGTSGDYTGAPEYALNLDIALLVREILEQRGYQVVMTRMNNETAISNRQRAELAASEGAEIFVRIHANSSDDHSTSGALMLSPSSQNPYVSHLYAESERLSSCILDAYCQSTGFRKLSILYDDTMTGINWSQVPVTIIEMGFMSNEHDDTMMNDPEFRKTMAAGIADGIDLYFSGASGL